MAEKIIISCSIDVTKVAKERLKPGKTGGKYLSLALIETPDGKYGNHFMVVEELTKEERLADPKRRGTILGNAKFVKGKPGGPAPQPQQGQLPTDDAPPYTDDSVPF